MSASLTLTLLVSSLLFDKLFIWFESVALEITIVTIKSVVFIFYYCDYDYCYTYYYYNHKYYEYKYKVVIG